ncbi:hypothetical protein QVD17_39502 [Tagetes erecta]|uniref:Uncharacterized protein n=1 Tax=Tagetes erecta TaxID=13708 RepID=A0AAD8JU69_TARER|nr:hypothetical protein QVD17_39502 [Tagetes erecta]
MDRRQNNKSVASIAYMVNNIDGKPMVVRGIPKNPSSKGPSNSLQKTHIAVDKGGETKIFESLLDQNMVGDSAQANETNLKKDMEEQSGLIRKKMTVWITRRVLRVNLSYKISLSNSYAILNKESDLVKNAEQPSRGNGNNMESGEDSEDDIEEVYTKCEKFMEANGEKCLKEFKEAVYDKEFFLKQKAKIEWLKLRGDSNIAYFHNSDKAKNHIYHIERIIDTHGIVYEDGNVADAFFNHFQQFLGFNWRSPLNMDELFTRRIDVQKAEFMI